MGAAASFSFWSPAEAEANELALQRQQRAADFAVAHLFQGVPTRRAKKSSDPRSPVWIEVHPTTLHDALTRDPVSGSSPSHSPSALSSASSGAGSRGAPTFFSAADGDPLAIDAAMLRLLPTGVLIDGRGGVRVVFSLHTSREVAYHLTTSDIANVQQV